MSVIEDNWDFRFDIHNIEKESYNDFQTKLCTVHDCMVKLLEDGFKIQSFMYNDVVAQNHDDEFRSLVEKNKQLRQNIDLKLEEISQQQTQYENYKRDQRLLSQEIKERHEAFLMAKKYYKKFLKMYYTIESRKNETQTIFIQFFTEAKKESENYSLRLLRETKSGQYELLNTTPKLPILKELQKRLKTTNDVPGALNCIRQAFMLLRASKKQ